MGVKTAMVGVVLYIHLATQATSCSEIMADQPRMDQCHKMSAEPKLA